MKIEISVILPIFNESEIINDTISKVDTVFSKMTSNYEILAVDDGSKDSTADKLTQLKKKYKRLRIITHKKNKGYGAALKSGIKNAKKDWILFTDADLQFNIADIKYFLPFTKDFDYVLGFRKKRADAFRRIFISSVYNKIVGFVFGLHLRDVDCAFKLMRRKAVSNIDINSDSFFVSAELLIKSFDKGYAIKEIGINHYARKKGESKVTFGKVIETIGDLIKLKIAVIS